MARVSLGPIPRKLTCFFEPLCDVRFGNHALHGPAAVDEERLSGDIDGIVGREKYSRSDHLFRFGGATERNHCAPSFPVVGIVDEISFDVDRTWSERIDAIAERRELDGELFGQDV